MDSPASWLLVSVAAVCGALRVRMSWEENASFFATPSISLGGMLIVLAAVWGLVVHEEGVSLTSSFLLALSALSVAIWSKYPRESVDDGCKYTPLLSAVCLLLRFTFSEGVPVYLYAAVCAYLVCAAWVALPRKKIEVAQSSKFVEAHLGESWWPIFVVVDEANLKLTSGGVERKVEHVEIDPPLQNGVIQIRTKNSDPYRIVLELQRAYLKGYF